jgi:hypothetical protein
MIITLHDIVVKATKLPPAIISTTTTVTGMDTKHKLEMEKLWNEVFLHSLSKMSSQAGRQEKQEHNKMNGKRYMFHPLIKEAEQGGNILEFQFM